MRILLDEDLPRRLAELLIGHEVSTVQRRGWSGVTNGQLLELAAAEFDVLLTMDQNLEFQQNLAALPIAVLVVEAPSNRMEHLEPMVPVILKELNHLVPKVAAEDRRLTKRRRATGCSIDLSRRKIVSPPGGPQ